MCQKLFLLPRTDPPDTPYAAPLRRFYVRKTVSDEDCFPNKIPIRNTESFSGGAEMSVSFPERRVVRIRAGEKINEFLEMMFR